jgi:sugar O-acyltransferase (sialic acid O-acetyltransferase NeuD family)
MLIIGAKGFAKEVLEVFHQLNRTENIAFYDEIDIDIEDLLFGIFPIIKNEKDAQEFFLKFGNKFTIGIGNPVLRFKMYKRFIHLGGVLVSSISPKAEIGHYGNEIQNGVNLMTGTIITNDVKIGKGVLINLSCTIGHDVVIGPFAEICPDVNVSGNCKIGAFSFIGSNSVILPGVNIGENTIIGAGSVVTTDIPDNCLAVGIPAKVIRDLEPLKY